jgi:ATP-binding cassette subfamily B protein
LLGKKSDTLGLYLRALRQAKPWWPALAVVFVLGLSWTPISLLLPLPLKIILDNVLGSEPLPNWITWLLPQVEDETGAVLMLALIMSVAIAVLIVIHNTADWVVRESLTERIVIDMRRRLTLKSLELSAFESRVQGEKDYSYNVIHDAPALQWVTIYGLVPIVTALASLLVLLSVTSQLSGTVTMLAIATSVPSVLLVHFSQQRMRGGWHSVKELEKTALAGLQEALTAWRVVVNCLQERRVVSRYESYANSAYRAKLTVMSHQAVLGGLMALGVAVGTAAILYVSVRDARAGLLTDGDLVLILAYVGQLYGPIQTIAGQVSQQQGALASLERAFALMDKESPIQQTPDARPLASARGEIEFRNVSFGYDFSVINNCSFSIPAGSWVVISGPSGAGKTTLANLLVRFIDPDEGCILLDGCDLRDYRLEDLRRQVALLGQESLLLSASIEENICFARPEVTKDEIIWAAKICQAHDFISALPEGYATVVGESGSKLSGGERQRIALARAYLKNSPILVLDEPTSALDMTTEKAVIAALRKNIPGRTVFVITHRPSVLEEADFILRVEKSRIWLSDVRPAESKPHIA